MISKKVQELFYLPTNNLLTSKDNVITVYDDQTLRHCFNTLSATGYKTLPVLDSKKRVIGLISLSKLMLDFEKSHMDFNRFLDENTVKDFIDQKVFMIFNDFDLDDVLLGVLHNSFICVTAQDGYFLGIITRKTILERFRNLSHLIDEYYILEEKKSE